MLKLVDIKKDYYVADTVVHALKGISLQFRKNEFVSILGQSGCGKTTLLNIIGGLDKYTSGDLIIQGTSTKAYKDRDWDTYRNHRIGFIFQSYNLIPHQNILSNVELALTIGGISAAERRERAEEALKRVGLGDHIKKYPNQLSGGQMQRVAIARALVNDPEILLADEPTGALDTKTSIQIMELIKEIAAERLVIMVTHNPELAMQYSTRIVRLLDGQVVEDSNPYNGEEEETVDVKKSAKSSNMSFLTSLSLSAKNLWSKKGRTAVTSVAGSIGIIGVCLVLALSAGIKGYITDMQDDMLSGNPISISSSTMDYTALTNALSSSQKKDIIENADKGLVYINSYVSQLAEMGTSVADMLISNEITKEYVQYVSDMPTNYYAAMKFNYGIDFLHSIYTDFTYCAADNTVKGADRVKQEVTEQMSISAIYQLYTTVLEEQTEYKQFASYLSMFTNIFAEAPTNKDYIMQQYDVLEGKVATKADEIMIVLDDSNEMTDLTLAQLGYITQDELLNLAYNAVGDEHYDPLYDVDTLSIADEIMGKTFTWYPNDSIYKKRDANSDGLGEIVNMTSALGNCAYEYSAYGKGLENGLELKVVGVLKPKEDISYGCLKTGVYYTQALAEYAIEQNLSSEIVSYAKEQNGTISSGEMTYNGITVQSGIGYTYHYYYDGQIYDKVGYVGVENSTSTLMSSYFKMLGYNISLGGGNKSITTRQLGGVSIPSSINIYPVDFDSKDLVTNYLDEWNNENEDQKISYTDSLALIISMINEMINIITIGLVAFTSISLVVSSVMIGVITYVSVVERTKEIGVLRSLGARKLDVSNLFNAETFIIGLLAGVVGVGFTYLVSIPVNILLHSLTGIWGLLALPWYQALIMVCISFALTMISGIIPARAAAKKDPVIALRSE